ncbi:hypothetical protein H5410_003394 [Solanum commersonii]|uniref:Uncharacterized protein n=1 Tax=Solanum commersonii TaxID=4109 RepID=A0A9J6B4K0_SOLCO|nr:hypothetical protein H5410_003394 [Solanum commersonii]
MDTTWQKGRRQLRRTKKKGLRPNALGESPNGLNLAHGSSVLSLERKDQIGDEREQLAHHRAVPRSSSLSPNELTREDAEGKSIKAMNKTKGQID